jgi:hypothetical protein
MDEGQFSGGRGYWNSSGDRSIFLFLLLPQSACFFHIFEKLK